MGTGGRPPARGEPFGQPDRDALARGCERVCGVDEVGRGPLAGPVVAAAVVLPPGGAEKLEGLGDSKSLSPSVRARLSPRIREEALGVALGLADPEEIDRLNILQASLLAMRRAVEALPFSPDLLLVDGVHPVRCLPMSQLTLIKGDARSWCIAAASIVAKEHRDALMRDLGERYPGYGFEDHAGYPTAHHRAALARLGPCPIHRRTFRGVRELLPPSPQLSLFEAP